MITFLLFACAASHPGAIQLPSGKCVRAVAQLPGRRIISAPPLATLEAETAAQITPEIAATAIAAAPAPAAPVPTLTRKQLRLMLVSLQVDEAAVLAYINAIADPAARQTALIDWQDTIEYRHDHPLVQQIGSTLGLSQAQIDAAFRQAALL